MEYHGYEVVDMDLPQHVHDGIIKLAKKYGVKKVVFP